MGHVIIFRRDFGRALHQSLGLRPSIMSVEFMPVLPYQEPLLLPANGVTIKNRLVKAAMVEGLSSVWTGSPNEAHYTLYKKWAESGFGMIISGNVVIDSSHCGTPGDLRIPVEMDRETLSSWSDLAEAMSSHQAIAIVQLVHTGRQSVRCAGRSPWTRPIAPSAVKVDSEPSSVVGRFVESIAFQCPREVTRTDMDEVVQQFVRGATLAKSAGFHGVQLHGSHGYLLSSFLSPKTNVRDDEYGGAPLRRLKFVLEVIAATRAACPRPFILGIKLNSADYLEGGLTEKEALFHIEEITKHGDLDFIEISGGSYENPAFLDQENVSSRSKARESMFSAFCSQAKKAVRNAAEISGTVGPVIMCTGGFKTGQGIMQAMQEDDVDLIGMGRAAAADPSLPGRLLDATDTEQAAKIRCNTYQVRGGTWLTKLVPSKLVGASITTLWHQFQMRRLSRDATVLTSAWFEYLLFYEIARAWRVLIGISSVVFVSLCIFR